MDDERIGNYPVHPAAQLFPLLDESSERFARLKASIAEHGQQLKILVRDGVLLDGRNRLRACLALGIPVRVEEYGGNSLPSELIGDLNLERRDLSPEERARIYAELELMTQDERLAAAQKAAGERGKERGKEGGRGHKKPPRTDPCEGVGKRDNRAEHARSTVGRVAEKAGVSYHAAREAVKEAKAKRSEVTAPARPQKAEQAQKPRSPGQHVQRTHELLLEFAARPHPIPRTDISRRLGGKTPRDERRQVQHFLTRASHVPWARIEKLNGGFRFTVNVQLKQLCEQQTPLPELGGWTLQETTSFFKKLRRTIHQKRVENACERTRRNWNSDAVVKRELVNLIEFIERELDAVPFVEDRYRFSPIDQWVEKRPTQPSAGVADPTEGDDTNVDKETRTTDATVNAGIVPELQHDAATSR